MGSRPFRVGLPTLPSTQRPQPRQVMTSPAATGLSGFRQTVWFTCTAPRWMASAALPRLMPKPADATPSSRRGGHRVPHLGKYRRLRRKGR